MGTSRRAALIDEALAVEQEFMRAAQRSGGPCWTRLDLTMTQFKAIMALDYAETLTVGGLAGMLSIGRPAASILVEGLVQQNLASREEDPCDRRRAIVRLSAAGKEILAELREVKRDHLARCLAMLDQDDLAALVQGMKALAAAVQEQVPLSLTA